MRPAFFKRLLIFVVVAILAIASAPAPKIFAADSSALPDPDVLGEKALAALRKSGTRAAVPIAVAAFEDSGEKSTLVSANFDRARFSTVCYLDAVDPADLAFYLRLNREVPAVKAEDLRAALLNGVPADLAVYVKKRGDGVAFRVAHRDGQAWQNLAQGEISAVTDESGAYALGKVMFAALRYNAVVVGQQDDLIIAKVAAPSESNAAKRPQGLLLKDSSTLWSMKDRPASGDGVVTQVKRGESFALFRIMIRPDSAGAIVPGTKILLEGDE